MSVISIKKIKQLQNTIGKEKFKRIVNDHIVYLKNEYNKPYPIDILEDINILTEMYKGKVGLPTKANTPQTKKYNKKLSYIDKIKIKNTYSHR